MSAFTKDEVIFALEAAATETISQAAFLDDPDVIGDKRQVPLLDRRASALLHARDILKERWGRW